MLIGPDAAYGPCAACLEDGTRVSVAAATVVISGRGYGHGVGMSQYGAYGMASQGFAHDKILAFYYPGTTIGQAPVKSVRALLADSAATVVVGSAKPILMIDAVGKRFTLPAGPITLDASLSLPVGDGGALQPVAGPIVLRPQGAVLTLGGKAYRGALRVGLVQAPPQSGRSAAITVAGAADPALGGSAPAPAPAPAATPAPSGLRVVNIVGLEAYLAGVVPREVPASWPADALQAQAVAARSYALAHRAEGQDFDLYTDERSQVYGGVAAEHKATTAAVQATAGQVLLHEGEIADTMFSASNGGRTRSVADAYPESVEPYPYLIEQDDPYDAAASPFAKWGPVVVPASRIESLFGLPDSLVDMTADATATSRPTQVTAVTASGVVGFTPSQLRIALGLRSSWLTIGVLSLARTAERVTFGQQLSVTGLARGIDGVVLEQRTATGWQALPGVVPGADGRFRYSAKALATTELRLSAPGIAAAPNATVGTATTATPATASTTAPVAASVSLTVPVLASVKLAKARDGSGFSGVLRPALPGAVVEIQFDESGTGFGWNPVATATVGADGRFSAAVPLAPGDYRAFVPASGGIAVSATPTVKVKPVS
jgi:stage II sporulation protein D